MKKSNSEPSALPRMAFWDHVAALRNLLLRAGVILVLFTIVFFLMMPSIFDSVILAPCNGGFPLYKWFENISGVIPGFPDFSASDFHVDLVNIKLASQFFVHMSTSFWLALVAAFPVIIYMIWDFVAPALYPGEKRGMRIAFLLGNIMFFIGVAVGYFLVFPLTLRFLAEYKVSELIPNQISLDSYIDNFIALILVMGLVFELPLVAWLLGCFGLLRRGFFSTYRRHAIVLLMILAAVVTPTGDPFTLMVVFLPIYGLWELSALLVPKAQPEEDDSTDSDDDGPSDSSRRPPRTIEDLYLPQYKNNAVRN